MVEHKGQDIFSLRCFGGWMDMYSINDSRLRDDAISAVVTVNVHLYG